MRNIKSGILAPPNKSPTNASKGRYVVLDLAANTLTFNKPSGAALSAKGTLDLSQCSKISLTLDSGKKDSGFYFTLIRKGTGSKPVGFCSISLQDTVEWAFCIEFSIILDSLPVLVLKDFLRENVGAMDLSQIAQPDSNADGLVSKPFNVSHTRLTPDNIP